MATEPWSVPAPAKVNLYLRVLGERSDGFHEIETLFQALSLHDDVDVELTDTGRVELTVDGPEPGPEADNLAYRAARMVLDATGAGAGARIRLVKRIPAGAGLGGGSSDAATALAGVNELLGAPLSDVALVRMAATLGSDVPFFLSGSTLALGRGRGERLEALPPLPEGHLVLALPPVHVSTAWAYRALDAYRAGGGEPACFGLEGDAPAGWREIADLAANDFQPLVVATHPEVARSLESLRDAGAAAALLSGSGAACFGVFGGEAEAARVAGTQSDALGWPFLAVRTLTAWPGRRKIRDRARP